MLRVYYFLVFTLLGFTDAHASQFEGSAFLVQESLVCSRHNPTQQIIFCPSGMLIHIVSAFHGPQESLFQSRGSMPERLTSCRPIDFSSSSSIATKDLLPPFCLTARDVNTPLKQLCEGKGSCEISPDQFATNHTHCQGISSNEVLIAYRCEPGLQMIQSRVICQDTYMEIKCTPHGLEEESIVVTDAQLVTVTDTDICPAIVESPSAASLCPKRLEVTARVAGLCGGEQTCSVMPDGIAPPPSSVYPSVCARRHLSLSYACVPPSVIKSNLKATGKHLSRQSRPRQPYQKKNKREQNSVHPSRSSLLRTYQQDADVFLNPPNLDEASYSAFMDDSQFPSPATLSDVLTSTDPATNDISMFPIVLGVLVGLVVLILLVLILIVFGFRTHQQRARYARRKALSDQANTDTTFSETDKIQQHQTQQNHQSQSSLTQTAGSPQSYGYQHSSNSITDGVMASTYLPHGMFSTEACWPVSPGCNYFDEKAHAFPLLGRDSGSQDYAQLPISDSYPSGLLCSHQNRATTMNCSGNRILPFVASHICTPSEGFSAGLQMCSPAVNPSLSTESDQFSGLASSHPSSFQALYLPSGIACPPAHGVRQQPELWVECGPVGPDTFVEAHDPPSMTKNPQSHLSTSFESLIEPPEIFKNHPSPSHLLINSIPPRMTQLRRLRKSCNGSEDWKWHEGEFSDR